MDRTRLVIILNVSLSLVFLILLLSQCRNKTRTQNTAQESAVCEVIWAVDFQDLAPGPFDYKDIRTLFGSSGLYRGKDLSGVGFYRRWKPGMENDQNISIVKDSENLFARNWFKKDQYGIIDTDWPKGSGYMYQPKIPGEQEEIWISHNIRWPEDRDWALSGSMGVTVRGGSSPYGCNPYNEKKHDGFIINLMWSKSREIKLSLYWPGKNDSIAPCGYSGPFKWENPAKPGSGIVLTDYANQWHNIALRIVLNDNYTPGQSNGLIEGFWDGMLAFRVDTLRLRTNPGVYIDHARSQFNHGGNDDRFAPKTDTYIDMDDIWAWIWKKDSGLPAGFSPWDKEKKVPLPNFPK